MSMWGALAQGINQTAGGIANAVLGRQASSQSWDRQKYAIKHRARWAVKDLRGAGLNPILAAPGGLGGGGGVNSPMAGATALGQGDITEGYKQDLAERQTVANEKVSNAQAHAQSTQAHLNSAAAMKQFQDIDTGKSLAKLNARLAETAVNNAMNLEEIRKGIRADNVEKEGRAELWKNDFSKGIMQGRILFPVDEIISKGMNLFGPGGKK